MENQEFEKLLKSVKQMDAMIKKEKHVNTASTQDQTQGNKCDKRRRN